MKQVRGTDALKAVNLLIAAKTENRRLRVVVQELIDALMGDLSDVEGIVYQAKQLLKEIDMEKN